MQARVLELREQLAAFKQAADQQVLAAEQAASDRVSAVEEAMRDLRERLNMMQAQLAVMR